MKLLWTKKMFNEYESIDILLFTCNTFLACKTIGKYMYKRKLIRQVRCNFV